MSNFQVWNGSAWVVPTGLWVRQGTAWVPVQEIHVSYTTGPSTTGWKSLQRYDIPAGPRPQLEQTQFSGGNMRADWTNVVGSTGLSIRIRWWKNGSVYTTRNIVGGGTTNTLEASHLSPWDSIEADLQYYDGAVTGNWGAKSDAKTYNA